MSTGPKESEDVFAFLTANPDKLAKAQIHILGRFQMNAAQKCLVEKVVVWLKPAVFTATM